MLEVVSWWAPREVWAGRVTGALNDRTTGGGGDGAEALNISKTDCQMSAHEAEHSTSLRSEAQDLALAMSM